MEEIYRPHLHRPPHLFRPDAIYIVAAAVQDHQQLLNTDEKKALLCRALFERAEHYRWQLEAWAVLSNHYHIVARSPGEAINLQKLIRSLHAKTAAILNRMDGTPGRRVWDNYWDTCITHERSYWARLHYVHTNPVRHGLVKDAEDYPFCSYRWFVEQAEEEFRRQVFRQPCDRVHIRDSFGGRSFASAPRRRSDE